MIKEININASFLRLSQEKIAVVDKEDYDWLLDMKPWHAYKTGSGFYAKKNIRKGNKTISFLMHRIITNCPPGLRVHHKDGNSLNNMKENLKVVTPRQHNKYHLNKRTSKYPGVYWNKRAKKWRAYVWINNEEKHLGYFNVELDAANAYKKALKDYSLV